MNRALDEALRAGRGVLTRWRALAAAPRWVLEHAVRKGHLVRLCPRVYVAADQGSDPRVRQRAALAYAGPGAALSHTTAVGCWGLVVMGPGDQRDQRADSAPVHVSVPAGVCRAATENVVVHRCRAEFGVRYRSGLPVTTVEMSIVDSGPLLTAERRRAPTIEAVASRQTTVPRLRAALDLAPRLAGRGELTALLDRLDAGCRTALELWTTTTSSSDPVCRTSSASIQSARHRHSPRHRPRRRPRPRRSQRQVCLPGGACHSRHQASWMDIPMNAVDFTRIRVVKIRAPYTTNLGLVS